MVDMAFSIKKRKPTPITFTLGGQRTVQVAVRNDDGDAVLNENDEAVTEPKLVNDGHEYTFVPPKQAIATMPMLGGGGDSNLDIEMTRAAFDWLGAGVGEKDTERILDRLKDPTDDLDFGDLAGVMRWLQERVAGRPTT